MESCSFEQEKSGIYIWPGSPVCSRAPCAARCCPGPHRMTSPTCSGSCCPPRPAGAAARYTGGRCPAPRASPGSWWPCWEPGPGAPWYASPSSWPGHPCSAAGAARRTSQCPSRAGRSHSPGSQPLKRKYLILLSWGIILACVSLTYDIPADSEDLAVVSVRFREFLKGRNVSTWLGMQIRTLHPRPCRKKNMKSLIS